jgi:hypothetical protein
MRERQQILLMILFLIIPFIGYSQVQKEYSRGNIENLKTFEILTEEESKMHLKSQEKYKRQDYKYKVDSLFRPGTAEERKKMLYELKLKKRVNYKENRSRFFIDFIKNDSIILEEGAMMPKPFSIPCTCILNNDSLYISMGLSFFGGFLYEIRIYENMYSLNYHEADSEFSMYRYSPEDSLSYGINLPILDSKLIFEKPFHLAIDEKITGHLNFKSPNYYIFSDFDEHSILQEKSEKRKVEGDVLFTCQIRKPLEK